MATKRTTKAGAATAAPNKQRLTLMTRAEKRAAIAGGVVDDRIPEEALLRRLKDEPGRKFDTDPILDAVRRAAGRCRGFHVPSDPGGIVPPRMEPAQIVAQAKATVAVIDELRERLSNLHPHIDCWANDVLYQSQSTFLHALNLRIDPDLLRIRAAIDHAGRIVGAKKVRTGPKQTELAMAKESLADALRENSEPRMPKKDARALSGELLGLCGLHSKRKPRPKHPDPRKRRQ